MKTLLVLDATTGQNAAEPGAGILAAACGVTGIILTKLDGTAKGGVVLPIKQELGLSVKFIGVGEQVDDLQPFDAAAFADALFDNQRDDTPAFAEDRERAELEAQAQAEEEREEAELLSEELLEGEATPEEVLSEESLISDIDAMLEEKPEEEVPEERPEKKRRRFWPFGRKRDEE